MRWKGVANLIHALHQAKFNVPSELFIVGGGDERENLERLSRGLGVADRVHFEGTAASIGSYLAAADVLVLPSCCKGARCEGIPRVVLESIVGISIIETTGVEATVVV